MQDLPTPLDHLSAFVLVFLLGMLSAWIWAQSHRRWRCWFRDSGIAPCTHSG